MNELKMMSWGLAVAMASACVATDEPTPPDDLDDTPVVTAAGGDPTAEGATGQIRVTTPGGLQTMTYVVSGGRALAEGDIDLGPIAELRRRHGGAVDAGELWPGGHVRFAFASDFAPGACNGTASDTDCACVFDDDGVATSCESARGRIRAVFAELDARLPIDVTEVSPSSSQHHILVQYNDDPTVPWGGHSAVGYHDAWGPQVLEFRVGAAGRASSEPETGTARHEILHALGLWHEQSRTDRDQFVDVDLDCVKPAQRGNYDVRAASLDYGPYDFRSIMHYRARTFCIASAFPALDVDGDGCACVPMRKLHPTSPDGADQFSLGGGSLTAEDVNTLFHMYADAGGTNEADDQYGAAVAIGDFDADGYDDVAVGAPLEDLGATNDGAVFIYRGTATGLVRWQTLGEQALGASPADHEQFGAALVVGHFDDDRFADLAIGAPGEQSDGVAAGAVFVLRGGVNGLAFHRTITQATPGGGTNNAGDRFGAALAAGDVAAVDRDALVVGAPGDRSSDTGADTGAVYLYQFIADGTALHKPTRVSLASAGAEFGAAVAVGAIDGDQNDDLVIGVPGQAGVGRVFMLSGRTPPENPLLWSAMVTYRAVLEGSLAGGRLGAALAVGDLTMGNTARREVAIGVPGAVGGRGQVVVREVASDFTSTTLATLVDPAAGFGANFGAALAIGNIDDTTVSQDLAIGEPGRAGGRVMIALGGTAGTLTELRQGDGFPSDDDAGDRYGAALALGHIDGFGAIDDTDDKRFTSLRRLDLVVGAPGEAPDFLAAEDPAAGAIYTVLGRTSLPPLRARQWHQELSGGL